MIYIIFIQDQGECNYYFIGGLICTYSSQQRKQFKIQINETKDHKAKNHSLNRYPSFNNYRPSLSTSMYQPNKCKPKKQRFKTLFNGSCELQSIITPKKKSISSNSKVKTQLPYIENEKFNYASFTYQGQRNYNEDRMCMKTNIKNGDQTYHFFAIYDGHGGSSTAEYLKIHLLKVFQKFLTQFSVSESLEKSIAFVDNKIMQFGHKIQSGSCLVVLVLANKKYYIANVGDSRIIKIRRDGKYFQLTRDHRPDDQLQKARIQRQGGSIYRKSIIDEKTGQKMYGPSRIIPGNLSVSRTIGDFLHKKKCQGDILSSKPDIFQGQLSGYETFVLMSDGAYEQNSKSDIVSIFKSPFYSISNKVKSFMKRCQLKKTADNVTVIGIETKSTHVLL